MANPLSDQFYQEMQQIANELHFEYQQGAVTITRKEPGPVNPDTPWIPGPPVETVYSLMAIVSGVGQDEIDGTQIVASDKVVQMAVLVRDGSGAEVTDFVPQMTDTLRIDGMPHAIKRIDPEPAAGIPVYFEIYVAG
jgi:hypothetical protein